MFGIVLMQDYRKCRGMVEQFLDLLSAVAIAPRVTFEIGIIVSQVELSTPSLESTEAVEPAVPPP
ncbi:hypothetical protein [Anatilimnocola floriformis]|uniref:hypothetical protein n=1 Tax=Anatilimnocola floriformis TaxID=2948575 RepID=UPI0020C25A9F|nr:hypothetical protein [Anatilimnocola floriformis]